MPECKLCHNVEKHLVDGVCLYCLAEESRAAEKTAMDQENDHNGMIEPTSTVADDFLGVFGVNRLPLPDLSDEKYVATHAGYDIRSKAWKRDGKELMKLVQAYQASIQAGDMDYGSAAAFLNQTKPNCEKRLVKRVGSACLWEYITEQ